MRFIKTIFLSTALISTATSGVLAATSDGVYVCNAIDNQLAECGNTNDPAYDNKTGCETYRYETTFKFSKRGEEIKFDNNFLYRNLSLRAYELDYSSSRGDFYATEYHKPYRTNIHYQSKNGNLMYTHFNDYNALIMAANCIKY